MKNIKEVMKMADVSRATIYLRLKKIEKIIGEVKKEYRDGKTNDDRILPDDVVRMIVDYQPEKRGRKPALKNTSLTGLTTEDIDEVLR